LIHFYKSFRESLNCEVQDDHITKLLKDVHKSLQTYVQD